MPGASSFASHHYLASQSANPMPEPYAQKQYLMYSDDPADSTATGQLPGPGPLPHTDFEPYYSEFSAYDSALDSALYDVNELGIANPPEYAIPATDPGPFYPAAQLSQFAMGFPSDPPEMPEPEGGEDDDSNSTQTNKQNIATAIDYAELSSSPPQSPHRSPHRSPNRFAQRPDAEPLAPPPMPGFRQNLDMLGISHPYGHRPRASLSRIIPSDDPYLSSSTGAIPGSTTQMPLGMRSPYAAPPLPDAPVSPFALRHGGRHIAQLPAFHVPPGSDGPGSTAAPSTLSAAPHQLGSMMPAMPASIPPSMASLSPALSEASSVSPDPGSPDGHDDDEFSWQPILTIPRSEQSEAIIEQQRKPKQKRRSCLPDGVVEEYVGTTDYEGVYMCLYPNCQRLFKRTYNLRSHIQTHLCDRPYICRVCHSNFVRPHDLRRHERCHSSDKPFVCPCGKSFNRQDALQRHRLREICEGAIHSGVPKSPKPRGRPKGRRNTPTTSPNLSDHSASTVSPALQ